MGETLEMSEINQMSLPLKFKAKIVWFSPDSPEPLPKTVKEIAGPEELVRFTKL
jgi:hypothetical protein